MTEEKTKTAYGFHGFLIMLLGLLVSTGCSDDEKFDIYSVSTEVLRVSVESIHDALKTVGDNDYIGVTVYCPLDLVGTFSGASNHLQCVYDSARNADSMGSFFGPSVVYAVHARQRDCWYMIMHERVPGNRFKIGLGEGRVKGVVTSSSYTYSSTNAAVLGILAELLPTKLIP